MKNRLLLISTCLVLAFAPFIRAEEAKPSAPKSDEPETELGGKMEKLNGAYRKLKRQVADPAKNPESLALVATIKKAAEESVAFQPEYTSTKPAADQAQFVANYKTEMKKMIEMIGKLEVALMAGKNDEAAKMIADLDAQQKSSHKEFRKPKKQAGK